jgi:hypothetical protein
MLTTTKQVESRTTERPAYRFTPSRYFNEGTATDNSWAARAQALKWADEGHFVRMEWSHCDTYSAYVTPRGDRYGWGLCLNPLCRRTVEADADHCRHCGAAS